MREEVDLISTLQYNRVGGLWCLTSLSTILQLYRGGQFYWWNIRRKSKADISKNEKLNENYINNNIATF
jgi:hypothetical protein